MKTLLFLSAFFCFFLASAKEKKVILHPNGKVQYEFEKDGFMLDGRFSCYYESGKLRIKGAFKSNQKTGQWRYWDENGRLRTERNYTSNQEFTVVHEYDSAGLKTRSSSFITEEGNCDSKDYFFTHSYISSIDKDKEVNRELFSENGFVDLLLQDLVNGGSVLYKDEGFTETAAKRTVGSYHHGQVVSLLVRENYHWCTKEQNLNNQLMGVCPVVMENGQPKELGWVYVPRSILDPSMLKKIKDHAYAAVVTKSTANDAGFRLQNVNSNENDLLRLKLIVMEANAILYMIDYDQSLAIHQ